MSTEDGPEMLAAVTPLCTTIVTLATLVAGMQPFPVRVHVSVVLPIGSPETIALYAAGLEKKTPGGPVQSPVPLKDPPLAFRVYVEAHPMSITDPSGLATATDKAA
jgi:hypothetical protein